MAGYSAGPRSGHPANGIARVPGIARVRLGVSGLAAESSLLSTGVASTRGVKRRACRLDPRGQNSSLRLGLKPSRGHGRDWATDPEPPVRFGAHPHGAGPPREPTLMDQDRPVAGMDRMPYQVAGGRAGGTARGDVLHAAGVVPGSTLRSLRIENVDELGADLVQERLEVGAC